MKKVARLVEFSLMTRVVVDENATQDEIIKASYKGIQAKIDNEELGDNLVENELDEECPFGTFDTDQEFFYYELHVFINRNEGYGKPIKSDKKLTEEEAIELGLSLGVIDSDEASKVDYVEPIEEEEYNSYTV